ncbi:MAG: protein-L-isoaspartate O-methyltransferase [Hyphomicrobiaceae bacterium]|nr:protein-L-isoaspartate O-methyltransferase [Hyphomicrobiaceae bacterium]
MTDAVEQRVNMVDSQVRPSDVTDRRIIRAMLDVPREAFVPPGKRALAYADGDVPLGSGRALLAPRVLAKLVQLADLGEGDRVLVAGCGTGYAAAVLAHMGATVVAVEADDALRAVAEKELSSLGSVDVRPGVLADGAGEQGPYDVILLEGAVAATPEGLLAQLKDGGRLVAIHTGSRGSRATVWRRSGRICAETAGFDAVGALLPGFHSQPAFSL